jgi:hypothetical protein
MVVVVVVGGLEKGKEKEQRDASMSHVRVGWSGWSGDCCLSSELPVSGRCQRGSVRDRDDDAAAIGVSVFARPGLERKEIDHRIATRLVYTNFLDLTTVLIPVASPP